MLIVPGAYIVSGMHDGRGIAMAESQSCPANIFIRNASVCPNSCAILCCVVAPNSQEYQRVSQVLHCPDGLIGETRCTGMLHIYIKSRLPFAWIGMMCNLTSTSHRLHYTNKRRCVLICAGRTHTPLACVSANCIRCLLRSVHRRRMILPVLVIG